MECRRAKTEVRSQPQRTQEIQRTNQMKQFIISGRVVLEKCVNNYLHAFTLDQTTKWCELFWPIAQRRNAKATENTDHFSTLKLTPLYYKMQPSRPDCLQKVRMSEDKKIKVTLNYDFVMNLQM